MRWRVTTTRGLPATRLVMGLSLTIVMLAALGLAGQVGQAALKPGWEGRYRYFMLRRLLVPLLVVSASLTQPAAAQEVETPYWVSIRPDEVNMRVGPGEDYSISWVYRRAGLPLKVLRIKEGWRLVEDPDGARGWMLARFLTRSRAAIVRGKGAAEMRETGEARGRLLWRVAPGVVGKLGDCSAGWCAFEVGPRKGWVEQSRLWGVGEP